MQRIAKSINAVKCYINAALSEKSFYSFFRIFTLYFATHVVPITVIIHLPKIIHI